jgi:hypothetical protein
LTLPASALESPDSFRIAASRSSGSASCVAIGQSMPNTWFDASASPGARSEIGTNATSGFFGSFL